MSRCGPNSTLLVGLSREVLQVSLQNAQQAYLQLSMGGKVESATYTQGDGSKSITYTRGNIAQLANVILMLQQQLGIVQRARRPLTFRFK
ncbi:gpW family protein [Pseudomonas chlororaphis]|uniref:gpW family protein n=1 Tax=Pseudomonas chlororaphis TaxID=587753 RepID=UPI00209A6BC4|nr:gpW family protein [Pseudomonas chlororaphis]MCO7569380.1 gpW family protein [Pseudomonas chlororaphis]MCO7586775.1 gpW family protein [Pseudomonas chlororaphis]